MSLVLTASPEVYNAKPNLFEPGEMGSEAIYVAVQMCLTQQGGTTKATLELCGCAVDAIRLNQKQHKADPTATAEQVQKCRERMAPPPPKPKSATGKAGV